jgi:hypothetical protein
VRGARVFLNGEVTDVDSADFAPLHTLLLTRALRLPFAPKAAALQMLHTAHTQGWVTLRRG